MHEYHFLIFNKQKSDFIKMINLAQIDKKSLKKLERIVEQHKKIIFMCPKFVPSRYIDLMKKFTYI